MYIAIIPNRKSPPAVLIRESYREDGKNKNRTLANISCLPEATIDVVRRSLKGEVLLSPEDMFEIPENGSPAHGHVDAVMTAMKKLKIGNLLSTRSSREKDIVLGMIAARLLQPQSKLATTLWWKDTTLPQMLKLDEANEDDLYGAMDWLLERQDTIEKKLAKRHLDENGLALYDLTSSYFEGKTCPLAALGHNRDKKKGRLQVNYGLLTNRNGIPVAVSVFKGNTGDPKTVMPQVEKMKKGFNLDHFVLVGDRGMLTQKQIGEFKGIKGIDWISALRPSVIKKIIKQESFQLGLFDERNLFELTHPDFKGERLIACRNEELALRRAKKREGLIQSTVKELEKVRQMVLSKELDNQEVVEKRVQGILRGYKVGKHFVVKIGDDGIDFDLNEEELIRELEAGARDNQDLYVKRLKKADCYIESIAGKLAQINQKAKRGRLYGRDKIGVRVGRVINKHKVAKHFVLTIKDDEFQFEINHEKVREEAATDGIYFVRTSLAKARMDADETVRSYKQLSKVEQAFRSFKSIDLMVRPIRHRLENRVRGHIFLCMLAYYVQWHMMEAWRPLLFADEEQDAKASRDPVAPAERSGSAMKKVRTKKLDDGQCVYSFHGLLAHLGAIVQITMQCTDSQGRVSHFQMNTKPNKTQQKAINLLEEIKL